MPQVRDEKQRTWLVLAEEHRLTCPKFDSDDRLCPICGEACGGFYPRSDRSALCRRRRSDRPDKYTLGHWHRVIGPCRCGQEHR